MRAKVGDWLIIEGRNVGNHPRRGLIEEAPSADGGPPYLVRWTDTGHQALTFPGPDAHIVTNDELISQEEAAAARISSVQQEITGHRFGEGLRS